MSEGPASRIRRRVLIVDADVAFGHSIAEEFRSCACDVDIASTRQEALACVAAAVPDLVVLDLYLPDGAALELLRLWKAEVPALVVILVSGNASLTVVVDALREGARNFFTKPVSAAALIDELEERQNAQRHNGSPVPQDNHRLCVAALNADGVDRFFAISPGLLSVAGFDGYFKMLNPAWEKILGYSVDELCAKPYLELIHPDDRAKATDEALEVRAGQTAFRFKNRYRCKNGEYRWLSWIAMPSPAHRLIYASARDVTKSVRMEQGLRESNERLKLLVSSSALLLRESTVKNEALVQVGQFKDQVAAMIVHDLKSPLSVIVANYEYLLEGFEGSADCLEALRDSQNAGRRMLRLLENLVDVARLESGTFDVSPSSIVLSTLLQTVADQRRVLARSREITIVFTPDGDVTATFDCDLVTRTIENILDNALRHTPRGGSIEIEVRQVGADAEIRIGNSGSPIPIESRKSIFERYGHASSDVGRMNRGFGLYFCRLAVEAQGGEIWIEETDRLPTVFAVRLPRQPAVGRKSAPSDPVMILS